MLRHTVLVLGAVLLAVTTTTVDAWRIELPWDTRHWCDQIQAPQWPYAYRKSPIQTYEEKGRTASNAQDFRHICQTRGARSVCHRCEPIKCGRNLEETCNFQLQGVQWEQLPPNIPTVTDTPFAIGPNVSHRNDYGNASQICLFTQGGDCLQATTSDFSHCAVRCWGQTYDPPEPFEHGWTFPKEQGLPQGRVFTLAGGGTPGYRDGVGTDALFNDPNGVAVDRWRNVYVADTGNHVIRQIQPDGTTTTFAGTGEAGWQDGPAAISQFSSPTGITLLHDAAADDRLTIYVSDSGNHRIRRLRQEPKDGPWEVVTWAGGGTKHVEPSSVAGYEDGWRTSARFFQPRGIAVDDNNHIFVADTLNHLVRHIDPSGYVSTLAGTVGPRNTTDVDRLGPEPITGARPAALPGCPDPCIEGIPGYEDGPRNASKFSFPQDVSISEEGTVLVTDSHRVRRITRSFTDGDTSTIQGVESFDRVVTIAGSTTTGRMDGVGDEARFESPSGIMADGLGRIYVTDTLQCRMRRITPADHVAQVVGCGHRLVDIVRPSGCTLYDPPVDVHDRRATPLTDNIYHRRRQGEPSSFKILKCVGTPPPDIGATSSGVTSGSVFGDTGGTTGGGATGFTQIDAKEQLDDGTELRVYCPTGCARNAVEETERTEDRIPNLTGVYGTGYYADISNLCAAAAHAGHIDNDGGYITVVIEEGWGPKAGNTTLDPGASASYESSRRNDIRSNELEGWDRSFTIKPYPISLVEVYTLTGIPTAILHDACGYVDGQPPQDTQFQNPSAVAIYRNPSVVLTDTEYLYIADSGNHVIRAMTAICSQMCENGGRCVADETCECTPGWSGHDCTRPVCDDECPPNMFCTGNNECSCKPGYTGDDCTEAQCVQACHNDGECDFPDTCTCKRGWFDANCTTPVCDKTCGNGGNCTSLNVCECPSEWTGDTCRIPVCSTVLCVNGGICVAPDTCRCPPEWSGHDCSKPVCNQGFFRPDPILDRFAPLSTNVSVAALRPLHWAQYVPCVYEDWCNATNEFDCQQLQRAVVGEPYDPTRTITGFHAWESPDIGECFRMELHISEVADTAYRFDTGTRDFESQYARVSGVFPYPSLSITRDDNGVPIDAPWASPIASSSDRQVALVQYMNVTQGVYICANGGNCTGPDLCHCAPGWSGFDCRTPVCTQGYHRPTRQPRDPVTGLPRDFAPDQGTYVCSERAVQIWENEIVGSIADKFPIDGYVHEHPNYFSRHMNETRGWPDLHELVELRGNDTVEGFRRDGVWVRTGRDWEVGECLQQFRRTCPSAAYKEYDVRDVVDGTSPLVATDVTDTYDAFRPRVTSGLVTTEAYGRWFEPDGECIDYVLKGCFNEGTCVAPDTCECAPGWEGHDCSIPICEQSVETVVSAPGVPQTLLRADGVNVGDPLGSTTPPVLENDTYLAFRQCPNSGNCTHPDTCTCEKGWEGYNCTIPICAQECHHDGVCIAPDTCACHVWANGFRDGRDVPVFQQDTGDARITGWTGYDCNTPICVQAEQFILNVDKDDILDNGNGSNIVPLLVSTNIGNTYQAGCVDVTRFTPDSRTRVSDHLCFITDWYQGSYDYSWANGVIDGVGLGEASVNSSGRLIRSNFDNFIKLATDNFVAGPEVLGEGVYACYNAGSCVAPDTCECPDGWDGFDCDSALCRHTDVFGSDVGCYNGGICGDRDECTCIQRPSILYTVHPQEYSDETTGYNGTDCSMAICVQGLGYDDTCVGVPGGPGAVSTGGEGCHRCANGGNCTAPDFCTCAPEWTGYDCRTPVCTRHADSDLIFSLNTVDPAKVARFELDPCGSQVLEEWAGILIGRGNCTRPDQCTCFCRDRSWRDKDEQLVQSPWHDNLKRYEGIGFIYGRFDCLDGWEGQLQDLDTSPQDPLQPTRVQYFETCHLQIFVPGFFRRYTLAILIGIGVFLVLVIVGWIFLRRKLRNRYNKMKAARRLSRRSSQEDQAGGAFGH